MTIWVVIRVTEEKKNMPRIKLWCSHQPSNKMTHEGRSKLISSSDEIFQSDFIKLPMLFNPTIQDITMAAIRFLLCLKRNIKRLTNFQIHETYSYSIRSIEHSSPERLVIPRICSTWHVQNTNEFSSLYPYQNHLLIGRAYKPFIHVYSCKLVSTTPHATSI